MLHRSQHHLPTTLPDGEPYAVQLDDDDMCRRFDFPVLQRVAPGRYRAPFSGEYENADIGGGYCKACDAELLRSEHKFHTRCDWPPSYAPIEDDAVVLLVDHDLGFPRSEVRCRNCGSYLGHLFQGEGYPVPTNQRWCINSVCLTLESVSGHSSDMADSSRIEAQAETS